MCRRLRKGTDFNSCHQGDIVGDISTLTVLLEEHQNIECVPVPDRDVIQLNRKCKEN